jgi:membrane-anchored mycosin MYCP
MLVKRLVGGHVVLVGALLAGLLPMVVLPGGPASAAEQCATAGTQLAPVPWAQQRLAPETIWPVADGSGVRVAVLSSGVDATQPQLAGRVAAGFDELSTGSEDGGSDCEGLGTQVAGIIAARQSAAVGFHGLAPKATIVPVRVAPSAVLEDSGETSPAKLAKALRDVVATKPAIIVVPVVTYVDDPALRAAVASAVAKGIVVIAAVGDVRQASDGPGVPYPAAYPKVVGVGAVDADGNLGTDSAVGYVDLVAPGEDLISTQRGGGLVAVSGTGIAAAYVAGTAALVRSRWKSATGPEVVRRLLATATPMGGDPGYGYGMVSPAQAVTETMASAGPSPMPTGLGPPAATLADRAAWRRSTWLAVAIAANLLTVAALVLMFAVALPRGRQRRWRPGIAPRPAEHPEDDLPSPPVLLFEDRT